MSFTYVDYGNHGTWVDAHQGYSWCDVNKMLRHFIGSSTIYPAVSGDVKLDSHVYVNQSANFGSQIVDYVNVLTTDAYATVGIVEDEEAQCGRYYVIKYTHNGTVYVPTTLMVYDSSYTGELDSTVAYPAWEPFVPLAKGVEKGMRVVNLGRTTGTYLFYLAPGTYTTTVYAVVLPPPGSPASDVAPNIVASLDFVATDRLYVIQRDEYNVTLIIGNSDNSEVYTSTYVNYNVATKAASPQRPFYSGYSPFSSSYAASKTRLGGGMAVLMEPAGSREEIANLCATPHNRPAVFTKSTGNSWNLLVVSVDDRVTDDMSVTPFNFQPGFSGAFGDAAGGIRNLANTPMYLGVRADYPVYVISCKSNLKTNSTEEQDAFVYRKDLISDVLPTHGQNRLTSNIAIDAASPPFGGTYRNLTSPIVAGMIYLETPADIVAAGVYGTRLASCSASRLDGWRFTDNSQQYGYPVETPSSEVEPYSSDYDFCTDDINGVVASADNLTVTVVGWVYHG